MIMVQKGNESMNRIRGTIGCFTIKSKEEYEMDYIKSIILAGKLAVFSDQFVKEIVKRLENNLFVSKTDRAEYNQTYISFTEA